MIDPIFVVTGWLGGLGLGWLTANGRNDKEWGFTFLAAAAVVTVLYVLAQHP